MIQVILLAIALAMDAFAVSISLGAKQARSIANKQAIKPSISTSQIKKVIVVLASIAALYFGVAQGIMPLIGYLLGHAVLGWLASAAPWIACVILVAIGLKMLYEVYSHRTDDEIFAEIVDTFDSEVSSHLNSQAIDHKLMLSLAIATSIDAMAAGFTLNLLTINAWIACLIIALVTAVFGFVGVYLGYRTGTWLEDKAEILGGVVLIGIGVNMVI